AGNLANLEDVLDDNRLCFMEGDICDESTVAEAMAEADIVVHLAAETHVDRSIMGGDTAARTNFLGTQVMLETARRVQPRIFLHVSTDEVYGDCPQGAFIEDQPLRPRNPYSASKAAADHLAYAYHVTYGVPVVISRPANNYGPYQYPEKLVPFFVYRALRGETLPLYGDGQQVRDWLHVEDHCRAMQSLIERGKLGEAYNLPAGNERTNLTTARLVLDELGRSEELIQFVADRPGHDVRYALNGDKVAALGWKPVILWEEGLRATVRWFAQHSAWLEQSVARSKAYFEQWYAGRGG
ncbi:MAG: dTDP-glucose 4,6-dehydratase, partial [candidate division WS1 bacterium]|nr:dTDP-glucose 4,6-dehydratase [candidate division WS1 bacterium]